MTDLVKYHLSFSFNCLLFQLFISILRAYIFLRIKYFKHFTNKIVVKSNFWELIYKKYGHIFYVNFSLPFRSIKLYMFVGTMKQTL